MELADIARYIPNPERAGQAFGDLQRLMAVELVDVYLPAGWAASGERKFNVWPSHRLVPGGGALLRRASVCVSECMTCQLPIDRSQREAYTGATINSKEPAWLSSTGNTEGDPMEWLTIWGPGIAAVLVSAALTGAFGVYKDWRHRQGIRALLTQEILHNQTALLEFRESLLTCLREPDPGRVVSAYYATLTDAHWQTTRWDLPDIGECVSPAELLRLAEWYVTLEGLTFLQARTGEMLTRLVMNRAEKKITMEEAAGLVVHIKGLLDVANGLIVNPPQLPDKRLETSKAVRRYVAELDQRTGSERKVQSEMQPIPTSLSPDA